MSKHMSVEALAKLLTQASIAYGHNGPEYLAERMLGWIRELRAMCDDAELMLTDWEAWERKAENERDTGELEVRL